MGNQRSLEFITALARKAGKAILDLGSNYEVKNKEGYNNYVTSADLLSEKIIVENILEHFPDDQILSEENYDKVENAQNIDNLWIIDPLDGTANFKYHRKASAISIGLVQKGEIVMGTCYDFYQNELYAAQKGKGSFMNNQKLQIPEPVNLNNLSIATDNFTEPQGTKKNLQRLLNINPIPSCFIKGSAVIAMCDVANGRMDGYFHEYLKPWDNAAAFIIIREAGGVVKDFKGNDANCIGSEAICGHEKIVNYLLPFLKL